MFRSVALFGHRNYEVLRIIVIIIIEELSVHDGLVLAVRRRRVVITITGWGWGWVFIFYVHRITIDRRFNCQLEYDWNCLLQWPEIRQNKGNAYKKAYKHRHTII